MKDLAETDPGAQGPKPTSSVPQDDHSEGMDYLHTRMTRWVYLYLPLSIISFVLLFPFYWMATTALKPNEELLDIESKNPLWVHSPTLEHMWKLLTETQYPLWMWNTMLVAFIATFLSLFASVCAAYAIERIRFRGSRSVGGLIFLAYLVPPSILFIPLAIHLTDLQDVFRAMGAPDDFKIYDSPLALILVYPTILIPFCTWLLMGYFRSIPYELEECALIDGASRLQILVKIIVPMAVPGLISAGIFGFTLCWNEFIYALTFVSGSENKTVPVAVLSELVDGDVYHWGQLMAGALLGSLPVCILYMFFVDYYVASMTGAVKE